MVDMNAAPDFSLAGNLIYVLSAFNGGADQVENGRNAMGFLVGAYLIWLVSRVVYAFFWGYFTAKRLQKMARIQRQEHQNWADDDIVTIDVTGANIKRMLER
ncbi:MAG TPA: hypothetical protein VFO10_02705 [Oligoflexus sp.]|uniref:hypothetical protein n=1 Tax=Oligoflexus sp. TaxID=1971216 RepID=UPI002D7EA86E|nr:hypothetical protein [Oligoflexus sp.]HET9236132.1 hypothetical protein [Oligoflexus sp.]